LPTDDDSHLVPPVDPSSMDLAVLASSTVPAGLAGTIVGIVGVLLTVLWIGLLWR
jgi:hypothetical protein